MRRFPRVGALLLSVGLGAGLAGPCGAEERPAALRPEPRAAGMAHHDQNLAEDSFPTGLWWLNALLFSLVVWGAIIRNVTTPT